MQSRSAAAPARPDAQRAARYNHLVERLRNRQITMEEATELFGLMNAMLRASETARLALAASPPSTEEKPRAPHPKPTAGPTIPAPDDLMVAGILAMGAGAGLLAAITKRMSEGGAAALPANRSEKRPAAR
jgi:hypothetical protein